MRRTVCIPLSLIYSPLRLFPPSDGIAIVSAVLEDIMESDPSTDLLSDSEDNLVSELGDRRF